MNKIGILGAGGQADELKSFLGANLSINFYAMDNKYVDHNDEINIDIIKPNNYQKGLPVIAAVGAPLIRKAMISKWPGKNYISVVVESACVDETSIVGSGCIIAPQAIVTTNVKMGDHIIVNIQSSISHNCELGDYVTISPGVHLAGNVKLGDGVFVGIGAVISNNVTVASGVVIGAGAVVLDDVLEPNSVVVGAPARQVNINKGWLGEI